MSRGAERASSRVNRRDDCASLARQAYPRSISATPFPRLPLQSGWVVEGLERECALSSLWRVRRSPKDIGPALAAGDEHALLKLQASTPALRPGFETGAELQEALAGDGAPRGRERGATVDGLAYYVMDLLQGESLKQRLERSGRLGVGETAAILGRVCTTLERLHVARGIHRDVTPCSIFLERTESAERAHLLGFSIACRAIPESFPPGAIVGTPHFMAPEQCNGLVLDTRADVWSVGAIAFRCVTGRLPYEARELGELLVEIIVKPQPLPSAVMRDVPRGFDEWFVRANARDLGKRFQTAKEAGREFARLG